MGFRASDSAAGHVGQYVTVGTTVDPVYIDSAGDQVVAMIVPVLSAALTTLSLLVSWLGARAVGFAYANDPHVDLPLFIWGEPRRYLSGGWERLLVRPLKLRRKLAAC